MNISQQICQIQWHKLNEKAIIPTKRKEDAGFDIYTIEDDVWLMPGEKHLFSTGLTYNIDTNHWLMVADRGSTGSRGLHTHCGVCDQGYRGEIFICLCNDNMHRVHITSAVDKIQMIDNVLCYPTSKAIAQLLPMVQVFTYCEEIDDEKWEEVKDNSKRGETKLGESGK